MTPIDCIFLIPTTEVKASLRRYSVANSGKCPSNARGWDTHDTEIAVGTIPAIFDDKGCYSHADVKDFKDDPRWPKACICGYEFKSTDEWQVFGSLLYKVAGNETQLYTLRDAPVGAIWESKWLIDFCHGPDGKSYTCRIPSEDKHYDWNIDGTCSNCTEPCGKCHREKKDCACESFLSSDPHNCWIRHGTPPNFTVDKQGHTCRAGAGSIITDGWHGFLRNGQLVEC